MKIDYPVDAFDYSHIPVPEMWTVVHRVDTPAITDIDGAVRDAMKRLMMDSRIKPGAKIAVGVGSRGINNLVTVVKSAISELKIHGTEPFIVPAMGSHGGATAEGQIEILAHYGITEATVGAPVRATMEVEQVAALDDGYPVYFDRNALSADGVIVINRIKCHTDFTGDIESGLCKMLAIGLGKRKGADTIHRFGAQGLRNIMPEVGRRLVKAGKVIGGIGLIENPNGKTAEIHGLVADEIGQEAETVLLNRARNLMPRLAFDEVDVLVLDEMGKNISGAGMDTNVIGRLEMPSMPEEMWQGPSVRVLCVMDLTDESHGNAAGLGLADMVPSTLIEKIDFSATWTNHRTSGEGGVRRSKLPLILRSPEAVLQAAIGACGKGHPDEVAVARIRNTEFVTTLEVTAALLKEVEARIDLEVISGPHKPDFATKLSHN